MNQENQLIQTLKILFDRDLNKLKAEIELYRSEKNIWLIDKGIANSGGNLCLHLIGNLNTYIGAQLGMSGYVRNRDLEFSLKNVPRSELLQKIEETKNIVAKTLSKLSTTDLENEYPIQVLDRKTSTGFFLVHLVMHLDYHLGQINYHRRLLDK